MAIQAKGLADGTLPSSRAALYTAPLSTTAFVESIVAHNPNAAAQTVQLFVNRSGAARVIARVVLEQNETLYYNSPVMLETGDSLEGQSTTDAVVHYSINGLEES